MGPTFSKQQPNRSIPLYTRSHNTVLSSPPHSTTTCYVRPLNSYRSTSNSVLFQSTVDRTHKDHNYSTTHLQDYIYEEHCL